MASHPLILVDAARAEQFHLLGHARRLLSDWTRTKDSVGNLWAVKTVGRHVFGCTWLGPGWVFDPYASRQKAEEVAQRRRALQSASPAKHRHELAKVVANIRLGHLAERLLWLIHQQVLRLRTSLLWLPDELLGSAAWGLDLSLWPRHWRKELLGIMKGLAWIHVASTEGENVPELGMDTALLHRVGDLRGTDDDRCDEACVGLGCGHRHHHVLINVGRGFLGVLEQFTTDDEGGVRTYAFPLGGRRRKERNTLRKVGKTGQLVSIFLPAKLGCSEACKALSSPQHRLLQAIVRETTRKMVADRQSVLDAEVTTSCQVPAGQGKRTILCPLLSAQGPLVGFNGNKLRRGRGYRLRTTGGWLAKASYLPAELSSFLADLAVLCERLGLVVVALDPTVDHWSDLERLHILAGTPAWRQILDRLHVRIFTGADYLTRWNRFFGWEASTTVVATADPQDEPVDVLALLKKRGLTQGQLAAGLGEDRSFLSKLLRGLKPWPDGKLDAARQWIAGQAPASQGNETPQQPTADANGAPDTLAMALDYHARGWAVVPQLKGAKHPCVKWKPFQTVQPNEVQVRDWLVRWPQAGLVAILGPVGNLLAIDVDGEEAHNVLMQHLGQEPNAPKALSGSNRPFRYHLFFRHPDLKTKPKVTPWHPKLEFRGRGGIIVLPPSLHPSGGRYRWVPGRSLTDLPLPELPGAVIDALQDRRPARPCPPEIAVAESFECSPSTREFLAGRFANGSQWNDKLFRAACDLAGRDVARDVAEPMLLRGAIPWDATEQETAVRTILSAYSQPREPGRV